MDRNGILWSAAAQHSSITRYDTTLPSASPTYTSVNIYGIGIDPITGNIWHSYMGGRDAGVVSPAGTVLATYYQGGYSGRGIAVDAISNVWVALSGNGVGHLR